LVGQRQSIGTAAISNDDPASPQQCQLPQLPHPVDDLEGTETGAIRKLDGFSRDRHHTVPTHLSEAADAWEHRLLDQRVKDEMQERYNHAKEAMNLRRRDLRMETDEGGGDLDTPAFRYSIQTGQNQSDPAEWRIVRRLELRQGWAAHREAIDAVFADEFARVVVEFDPAGLTYDHLVETLEDVADAVGGSVQEVTNGRTVTYRSPDGALFAFDIRVGRVAISFNQKGFLSLVDAARSYALGLSGTASAMLPAPSATASSTPRSAAAPAARGRRGE
jgi:hypothetical protein